MANKFHIYVIENNIYVEVKGYLCLNDKYGKKAYKVVGDEIKNNGFFSSSTAFTIKGNDIFKSGFLGKTKVGFIKN